MAFVKTEVQGAVEIITIDRPKALNALNPEVLADLKAAFEAVDQSAIRCIVLTGEGDKSFVAGADIGSMSTMTKAEGEAFGKLGNDVFLMIEHFPIPVIAAVNGFALGGGNELAMSCDFRICSDNAVFGQNNAADSLLIDCLKSSLQVSQNLGVQGVQCLRAVDGDDLDSALHLGFYKCHCENLQSGYILLKSAPGQGDRSPVLPLVRAVSISGVTLQRELSPSRRWLRSPCRRRCTG